VTLEAGSGLTDIGDTNGNSFKGCTSLATFGEEDPADPKKPIVGTIDIMETITTILPNSFEDTAFKNAVINMVTGGSYLSSWFTGSKIEKITFKSITGYNYVTFNSPALPNVNEVVWDSTVSMDVNVKFTGLTNLKTLTVSKNLDNPILASAFQGVTSLENLVILDDQYNVGKDGIFVDLPSVKNVTIGPKYVGTNPPVLTAINVQAGTTTTPMFNAAVKNVTIIGPIDDTNFDAFGDGSAATPAAPNLFDLNLYFKSVYKVVTDVDDRTIPGGATGFANGIKTVRIGKGINAGANTFTSTNLTAYIVDPDNAFYASYVGDGVLYSKTNGAIDTLIQYPVMKTTPEGKYVIAASTKTIGFGAFGSTAGLGNTDLIEVTIPEDVTKIDWIAFYYLPNLETVNWNAINVTSNGDRFPLSVKYMNIGNKVRNIPSTFLDVNPNVTTITIPENVETIGATAFTGCLALTEVKFYATKLTTSGAFANIKNNAGTPEPSITNIVLGNKVTVIPANTFEGAAITGLKNIGAELTTIGDMAFNNCDKLTSVDLPDTLGSIGNSTFLLCDFLTTVIIRGSALIMGSTPFNDYPGTNPVLKTLYDTNRAGEYTVGSPGTNAGWVFTKFQ
jgi:hypothetical protein